MSFFVRKLYTGSVYGNRDRIAPDDGKPSDKQDSDSKTDCGHSIHIKAIDHSCCFTRTLGAHSSSRATVMDSKSLTDSRYTELLEKVIFDGDYDLSDDEERQIDEIRYFGSRVNKSIPSAGSSTVEMWEAEQFRRRISDLNDELGPPSLTDHLKTLNDHTANLELKRFHARTRLGKYPKHPARYQIPIRALNG